MWQRLKSIWSTNHTIVWGRLQVLAGILITAFAAMDPSLFAQYVPTAYLPIYFIFAGAVTEAVRRYKARDLG